MSSADIHDLEVASELVAQLFTSMGKEMTPLEVNIWTRAVATYGPDHIKAFAEFWMEGGGGQGKFRRVPTIEDLRRRVDPCFCSAEDALERLRAEVARTGPYATPAIADPRLKACVILMGGWPKVCQDLPDASEDFATRRFAERFASAWVQAEGKVMRGETFASPLIGLGQAINSELAIDGGTSNLHQLPGAA